MSMCIEEINNLKVRVEEGELVAYKVAKNVQ